MPDADDLLARMRAEAEQRAEGAADLARAVVVFRRVLLEAGVADDAADEMAVEYFRLVSFVIQCQAEGAPDA